MDIVHFFRNKGKKDREKSGPIRHREVLTFLLFLFFALVLWFLNNMERTFEADIIFPLRYRELPPEVVVGNELPKYVRITVRDKGQTLYHYAFHPKAQTLDIDLMEWKRPSGIASIPMSAFASRLFDLMKPSSQILRYDPDSLIVYYLNKESKTIPVRLRSSVTPDKQYMMVGDPIVEPATISIYAPAAFLQEIDEVETELLTTEAFKDSATFNVPLKPIEGVQFSQSGVSVTLKAESFTETSIDIPVRGVNFPEGYRPHTFPSTVSVSFLVRESQYGEIQPNDFEVLIDYNNVVRNSSEALQPLLLSRYPSYAVRTQINPDRVECIIERKYSE